MKKKREKMLAFIQNCFDMTPLTIVEISAFFHRPTNNTFYFLRVLNKTLHRECLEIKIYFLLALRAALCC